MKKTILLFLASLSLFAATEAQAQEWCGDFSSCYEDNCYVDETGFYAKVFGGANFLQKTSIDGNKADYKTGYTVSGILGYCWDCGVHAEAEYAYRRNAISKIDFISQGSSTSGHFQASSVMANLLWEIPLSSWGCSLGDIRPLLGAGIGYDYQKMRSSNSRIAFDQKWNHFSWQVMAGLAYPIFCNTEITLEYKFHQGGSHFNNNAIGAGIAYKFGF